MALETVGIKTHIWNNNLRSILFLLFYPVVITATYILLVGTVVVYFAIQSEYAGGESYLEVFVRVAFGYWYVPYLLLIGFLLIVYFSNRNRMDMARGLRAVTRENNPQLYGYLEQLCISRGMVVPYFFVQKHLACNAYTSGLSPHTYRIVITSRLLEELNGEEIEAVLAHELAHLINGDTRLVFLTHTVSHILGTLSGLLLWEQASDKPDSAFSSYDYGGSRVNGEDAAPLMMLGMLVGLVLKLGNVGALFAQMFVSRKREYIADAGAVELTKNPQALISALQKIEAQHLNNFFPREAHKAALFHHFHPYAWIKTHPSIKDRIAAIRFYSRIENPVRSPWSKKGIARAKQAINQNEVVW